MKNERKYPNPSARTFGDIDFIVPKEQFDYTLSVLRRNSFDAFWESVFKKEAEKADLLVLAKTATKMCQRHLGLDSSVTWCIDADESLCDELMDYLLSSGNFGRKYGHDNQVMTVATDIQRIGLFRKLQKSGMVNWKAYRKHRWLKPFCWIYQIFRYLKQWFRSRKNIDLFKDRRLATQRAAMLERLEIH